MVGGGEKDVDSKMCVFLEEWVLGFWKVELKVGSCECMLVRSVHVSIYIIIITLTIILLSTTLI